MALDVAHVKLACSRAHSPAQRPLAAAIGLALAALLPFGASAGDGVYVNSGTDADCVAVHDDASGCVATVSDAAKCAPDDAATQTDRALFYGDAAGSGATSLSLGGELSVNSGRFYLGGANNGDMMIGDAGTFASGGNAVAIGSQAFAAAVTDVAAGTSATDAVNLSQMQAGDAAAIASARQYTDATATQTLGQAKSYTDSRVAELNQQFTRFSDDVWMRLGDQDRRIDRQGAMGAAMTNMAMNAANARSPRGRVAIGAGWQNGISALEVVAAYTSSYATVVDGEATAISAAELGLRIYNWKYRDTPSTLRQ